MGMSKAGTKARRYGQSYRNRVCSSLAGAWETITPSRRRQQNHGDATSKSEAPLDRGNLYKLRLVALVTRRNRRRSNWVPKRNRQRLNATGDELLSSRSGALGRPAAGSAHPARRLDREALLDIMLDWPARWRRAAYLCLRSNASGGRDRDRLRVIAGYVHPLSPRQLEWLRNIVDRIIAGRS
jgi:hypothetical protein